MLFLWTQKLPFLLKGESVASDVMGTLLTIVET